MMHRVGLFALEPGGDVPPARSHTPVGEHQKACFRSGKGAGLQVRTALRFISQPRRSSPPLKP